MPCASSAMRLSMRPSARVRPTPTHASCCAPRADGRDGGEGRGDERPRREGIGVRVEVDGAWGLRLRQGARPRRAPARPRCARPPSRKPRTGGHRRLFSYPSRRTGPQGAARGWSATRSRSRWGQGHDCLKAEEEIAARRRERGARPSCAHRRAQDVRLLAGQRHRAGARRDAAPGSTPPPSARPRSRSARTRTRRGRAPVGYELVRGLDLVGTAPRVAEEAVQPPARRRVPRRRHHRGARREPGGPPGPRVDRPPHRARPGARHGGGLRRHVLPHAGGPRPAALRVPAAQRGGRRHHARRPRHLRLRRRGRPGPSTPIVTEGRLRRLPDVAGDGGRARPRLGGHGAGRVGRCRSSA